MSMTNSGTTTTERRMNVERHDRRRSWTETRLFAKTSEFWAMIVGVVAIAIIYNAAADSSFDLWRACVLGTVLGVAYIVSRGLAKAGTGAGDRWENQFDR